jgi:uncharacterized protein YicC (UPF0701 family)
MNSAERKDTTLTRKVYEGKVRRALRAQQNAIKRANLAYAEAVIQALLELKGESPSPHAVEKVAKSILEAPGGNPLPADRTRQAKLKRLVIESLTDTAQDVAEDLLPEEAAQIAEEIYVSLARQGRLK